MCLAWEPGAKGCEVLKSFHLHSRPPRSESGDRLGNMHTRVPCPRSKTHVGMGCVESEARAVVTSLYRVTLQNYHPSVCLYFLICVMGMIIAVASRVWCEG